MQQSEPLMKRGVLGRLLRDRRGNTLVIMAAAMIPVAAIAGSAIDTGRMYVVKVRLQQACDAGVLAGRKFMVSGASPTLDSAAAAKARTFFNNNSKSGWMQTSAVSFTPSKTADNQVAGAASAKVPMTLMKMFTAPDVTLRVACEARFDVADADVMFVLDTTGSMACPASDTNSNCASNNYGTFTRGDGSTGYYVPEANGAKIRSLREAVLDFYDTMEENRDPTTNLRYGFVPYSGNVNVGRLIPTGMLHTGQHGFSSRRILDERNDNNAYGYVVPNKTSQNCAASDGRYPNADKMVQQGWYADGTAYRLSSSTWRNGRCESVRQNLRILWRYETVQYDTAAFVAGDVVDPTKLTGEKSDRWRGCIEEVETTATATINDSNLPMDLNPDHRPTTGSPETMWKPSWPDVIYDRNGTASRDEYNSANWANWGGDPYYLQRGYAACGAPARRLGSMTRAEVETYLSANGDFRPIGGTYHDVGMIWGARLLSPTGIFAADTAAWPGRNAPNRHVIFMTDGAMAPNVDVYGLYGVEMEDRRITGNNINDQLNRHNNRFVAACRAARARNIEVWVIAFGTGLTQQMRDCATQDNNHVFFASDEATLKTAFTRIAKQIAMLRVSK